MIIPKRLSDELYEYNKITKSLEREIERRNKEFRERVREYLGTKYGLRRNRVMIDKHYHDYRIRRIDLRVIGRDIFVTLTGNPRRKDLTWANQMHKIPLDAVLKHREET